MDSAVQSLVGTEGPASGENAEATTSRLLAAINKEAAAAKAAAQAIVLTQQQAQETYAAAEALLSEAKAVATQALAAKTQVTDAQAVIATKSDHIENARQHADKVRAELDRTLTSAAQQATETEGCKTRAQTAADSVTALLGASQAAKGTIDTDAAAIAAEKTTAKDSAAALKALSDKAATVEKTLASYESQLADLEKRCEEQLQTITGLLPGAASAGLAHAFDSRRKAFLSPASRWQAIFVGALAALVALALTGMWEVHKAGGTGVIISYDELARLWLARLPVGAALVWLALHASRESALAKRLEEDYGYKAAISASFLGFHNQMSEIGSAATTNTPLAQLCGDTLATIANPPGRIYEKHELTVTPSKELAETAKSMLPVPPSGKA